VKRKFRLTRETDFKRVRRYGKSYAHPLVVLIAHPNGLNFSRFGISAGGYLGSAIQRNKAKRLIREVIRLKIPNIQPGWDILVISRRALINAEFVDVQTALSTLAQQAGVLK
jgi:ribonuclease P protein component